MSLLLDALKKAAQDKQKAATETPVARTDAAPASEPSLEFDLEQIETAQARV